MTAQDQDNLVHAMENARAGLANIIEMVERLQHCEECDGSDCEETINEFLGQVITHEEYHDQDDARQAIDEDPLSIEIRSDWYEPGGDNAPVEYNILLTTGGPALRIIGDLDEYRTPTSARLEYQDWFTPWTEYITTGSDHDALLLYVGNFYFGE